MKIIVKGQDIELKYVSYREKGFSRAVPTGYGVARYELVVPREEFIAAFGEYYKDYVEDSREFPEDCDGVDLQLQAAHWPELTKLISDSSKLLEQFLLENGGVPAIHELFRYQSSDDLKYWINTLEGVKVESQSVSFAGEVITSSKSN